MMVHWLHQTVGIPSTGIYSRSRIYLLSVQKIRFIRAEDARNLIVVCCVLTESMLTELHFCSFLSPFLDSNQQHILVKIKKNDVMFVFISCLDTITDGRRARFFLFLLFISSVLFE